MIHIHRHENQAGPRSKSLLDLIRESRVPGPISYHYERPGGYEAFAKAQGPRYRVVEAEENGMTLGFTQVTFDRVSWEDSEQEIAYSGDTRVALPARGRRISDRLIREACSLPVPVFGAVMSGNSTVLRSKLGHWRASGIDFTPVADLDACFYRPSEFSYQDPALSCRHARPEDLDSMFSLWRHYARSHNLTRTYADHQAFAGDFPPGTSLDTTWLIHEGSNLIAMMSLWDQDALRIIRVDSRAYGVSFALSLLPQSWLRIPSAGEELRILYSYRHAWLPDHPASARALRLLISTARQQALRQSRHFFCFGIDARDPMASHGHAGSIFKNRARIICDSRGAQGFIPGTRSLHLEVGVG
jgi:hypothetical protein